jgi:hypothetical protein
VKIFQAVLLLSFIPLSGICAERVYTGTDVAWKKGSYLLQIETSPSQADLTIDGEYLGKSPVTAPYRPRFHKVVVVTVNNPHAVIKASTATMSGSESISFLNRDKFAPIKIFIKLSPDKAKR